MPLDDSTQPPSQLQFQQEQQQRFLMDVPRCGEHAYERGSGLLLLLLLLLKRCDQSQRPKGDGHCENSIETAVLLHSVAVAVEMMMMIVVVVVVVILHRGIGRLCGGQQCWCVWTAVKYDLEKKTKEEVMTVLLLLLLLFEGGGVRSLHHRYIRHAVQH